MTDDVDVLEGETCPMCQKKTLTLMEAEREVPFFGMLAIFSMDCSSCNYHKADVEGLKPHDPVKHTFEISSEEDLKVRVVKSSTATVKIPHIGSIEPGMASNGYVTNIEGVINRIKKQIENMKAAEEDRDVQKKCKNLLKKITRILWGQEKAKLILEDPAGNSAIVSEKVKKN